MGIITGRETYALPNGGDQDKPAEWPVMVHWSGYGLTGMPSGQALDYTVQAKINHGRWIVDCPFCAAAQVGDPTDPRFFCTVCANGQVGQVWVKVEYPSKKDQKQIEDLLMERPVQYRNWLPEESVADIREQNEANSDVLQQWRQAGQPVHFQAQPKPDVPYKSVDRDHSLEELMEIEGFDGDLDEFKQEMKARQVKHKKWEVRQKQMQAAQSGKARRLQ